MSKFREKTFLKAVNSAFNRTKEDALITDKSREIFDLFSAQLIHYYDKIELEIIKEAQDKVKQAKKAKLAKILKKKGK